MKRIALLLAVSILSVAAAAQGTGQSGQQSTPAAGQAAAPAAPAGAKRPPQTKTQPEYAAWQAADASSRPSPEEQAAAKTPADMQQLQLTVAARTEKAADDFATKFPDSEVRILLYKTGMRNYQNANNSEKTEAMGRKVLALDADDPEALVTVSEVIAERTRDSDLDRDQRYDEATKMAQKSLGTIDTDISVPAGTPQDRVDAYKSAMRSQAYSVLGTIEYNKGDFAAAQDNLQKSIDAFPSVPDQVVVLRLALALDKQGKYPDALKVANRAVELSQEGSQIGTLARRERDRLQQLTGASAAPATPAQPPKN
ncbi:MAG TPA: tetratricopeptide repeat protein [Terriglobales bacterium]|nr:tetratricopeptide repeat protein [Terriglobales bacterium]